MRNENWGKDVLCGVVILYNPDKSIIGNIRSYINEISALYILDNSEIPDELLVKQVCAIDDKINYTKFGENKGIATALNEGCKFAENNGYKWILTMDQDSFFDSDAFFKTAYCLNLENIAIIAASYSDIHINPKPSISTAFLEVDFVITSGNLLNLTAWKKLGGFIDKLFIDEVDNEFCIRAGNNGYRILTSMQIYLIHRLGESISVKQFLTNKQLILSKHSPLRIYYTVRNNVYIWKKFVLSNPGFVFNRVRNIMALLFKISLYFPDKKKYYRYAFLGIKDAITGKYNKFSN